MSRNSILIVLVPIVLTLASCTDKDREMVRRTNDGTETFKYQPPTSVPISPKANEPKPPAPIPQEPASSKFVYKPDPRLLKQLSKSPGK
jgi:hypothetical protein